MMTMLRAPPPMAVTSMHRGRASAVAVVDDFYRDGASAEALRLRTPPHIDVDLAAADFAARVAHDILARVRAGSGDADA